MFARIAARQRVASPSPSLYGTAVQRASYLSTIRGFSFAQRALSTRNNAGVAAPKATNLINSAAPNAAPQQQQHQLRSYQYNNYYEKEQPRSRNSMWLALAGGVGLIVAFLLMNNTMNSSVVVVGEERAATAIPAYVQEYLFNTYKYVMSGISLTALSAYGFYRSGVAFRLLAANPLASGLGLTALMIGSLITTRMIDPQNFAMKHGAYLLFNAVMGLSMCTLGLYAPGVLVRAGLYTVGIFGATSLTAMTAKNDQFLWMGGPLFAGLMVVFLAGIGGMFLPARFARAHSIIEGLVMYGGLALFTGFMLYDTQKLMKHARAYHQLKEYSAMNANPMASTQLDREDKEEIRDVYSNFSKNDQARIQQSANRTQAFPEPDYINESLRLYMDLVNVFWRLVYIFGNRKQKK